MTPPVVVLGAGGILGVAAPLVLGQLNRLDRAPQAAAYLWMMATVGALGAIVLAGLLLVVGSSRLLTDLAVLLATCTMALRAAHAPTGAPEPLLFPASPSWTIQCRWPTACPGGWGADGAQW